jgi:hypothetical protein
VKGSEIFGNPAAAMKVAAAVAMVRYLPPKAHALRTLEYGALDSSLKRNDFGVF